jgi:hypothetical protein
MHEDGEMRLFLHNGGIRIEPTLPEEVTKIDELWDLLSGMTLEFGCPPGVEGVRAEFGGKQAIIWPNPSED